MRRASLLLVDDDELILGAMSDYLREEGYDARTATCIAEAQGPIENNSVDLVVSDVNLPDGDGFELLKHSREKSPDTLFVLITGYGTIENAVEAIRFGAYDYLTKPILADELKISIDRALDQRELRVENRHLREQLDERFGLDNIIGHDYRMLNVYDVIESVADTRTTVLITGESGTGKTLIARAIHRRSGRSGGPFVEVTCGALPETLLESELFGHKTGSFTGAVTDKVGKFAAANSGTIFLDEIDTASPGLQVKLLRVLQDMEFEPVGSTETMRVDARVILATNQDLADLVAEGSFRQDLYYRINVISLHMPPLRERISDIPMLAKHFLERYVSSSNRSIAGLSDESVNMLQRYHWPGNIRELENVIERAVVLGKGELIQPPDLPAPLHRTFESVESAAGALKDALQSPEKQIIIQALDEHGWNRQETAEALGINRTTLYKKMKKLGVEPEKHKLR